MLNLLKKWSILLFSLLIFLCFLPGFRELWQTYSSFWLFDNAVAATIIIVLYGIVAFKYRLNKKHDRMLYPGLVVTLWILVISGLLLLNNYFGGFRILPPILAYFAIYCLLSFFLKPSFWKKSIFVFILLIFTLPILERLQRFIGFPLRLITAKIVGFILQLFGIGNISNSTIIMTENYATTIDLPCSGVKSIYFGGILLLATYFLQQIKLSIRSIILALLFFLLLIFFNVWRVFSLTYVYGVLNFQQVGDTIHVFLGVVGFVFSCVFLWYGSEYLKKNIVNKKNQLNYHPRLFWLSNWLNQERALWLCIAIVIITLVLTNTVVKIPHKKTFTNRSISFSITNGVFSVIPFSEKEKIMFSNKDIGFSSKYALRWQGKNMNLLIIKSASARSYHDPELCLQGLGYQLLHEQALSVSDSWVKQIEIQTSTDPNSPRADVYYWYISKDKIITNYSERVWQEFKVPGQEWILIELAVLNKQKITDIEFEKLFNELNKTLRKQLFIANTF